MSSLEAGTKEVFRCLACFAEYEKESIRCPSCSAIHTFKRVFVVAPSRVYVKTKQTAKGIEKTKTSDPTISLKEVEDFAGECLETGIESLDDILGGGVFRHSVVMLGADPGTGKSTLTLQIADAFVRAGEVVLAGIAEEHPAIVKARIKRLGYISALGNETLFRLIVGNDWGAIEEACKLYLPSLLIVDSADRFKRAGFKGGDDAAKSDIIKSTCAIVHSKDACAKSAIILSHFNGVGEFKGNTGNEHDVDTTAIMRRIGPDSPVISISTEGKNRFGESGIVRYFEMGGKGAAKQGLVSIERKATSKDELTLSE